MFTYTLSQLAEKLQVPFKGEDITITGIQTLESAKSSDIAFLANPKYVEALSTTGAGAIIVHPQYASRVKNALLSEDPYNTFAHCIQFFAPEEGTFRGVSPLAFIDPSAKIGENCTIYPFAYIGAGVTLGHNCHIFPSVYVGEDSVIGNNCTLYPNSTLMSRLVLGDNCIIQSGAVLGADGFGFIRTPDGIQKIPQIGRTVLGNDVEIGANTTVDKAALDVTSVGSGTRVDNLVQIAHNVTIGKDCFIISQVGIAGSSHIGDNCTLAGQVGVVGHINIGSNVTVGPQSGVAKDIADNKIVGGSPPSDYRNYLRVLSLTPRLPELFKRMSALEKELEQTKNDLKTLLAESE